MTPDCGIGKDGSMPWHYPSDLKNFRRITTAEPSDPEHKNVLIMGWNTYESIGKPLPGRINVVLSRSRTEAPEGIELRADLDKALKEFKQHNIFIIGGEQIYRAYLTWYTPDKIYITRTCENHLCDRFFPNMLIDYDQYEFNTTSDEDTGLRYTTYLHCNSDESEYLTAAENVLENGNVRGDRTGVGTIGLFAQRLEFNLSNNTIPVLTTKQVGFLTLAKELLWFIGGNVDSKLLEQQKVKIWQGNSSREFLDNRGLTNYREGELGPVYGFQWRHFGAIYNGPDADYTGQGVDQLQNMITLLKTDPYSRRILMSAWNPADMAKMALPPCHIMYQLYVRHGDDGKKYLSAQMYQRSCDDFLGCPFNIASYALLTHIIAKICGMEAERLTMVFGDFHIYRNHVEQVREQLSRHPHPFPRIRFKRDLLDTNINDVTLKDFELVGYRCHPRISARMAV